jgi:hypothetical protein
MGRRHAVRAVRTDEIGEADREVFQCDAYFGSIFTGKQQVHQGYFVSIVLPTGEELFGEHPRWVYDALKSAMKAVEKKGWTVLVVARLPRFGETSLSANSGFGFHPAYPDRHVHMLDPEPDQCDD